MSPERPTAPAAGTTRGIVVIVVAVVLGVVLLARGGNGSLIDTGTAKAASKSSTTVAGGVPSIPQETTAPAPPATNAPAGVSVAIFNGTGGASTTAAGDNRAKLTPAGYTSVQIADTTATPTSAIYYANGAQGDAIAIANLLKLPVKTPQPMSSAASLPTGAQNATVIVIVGQDSAPGAGTTATT